jgi:gamma-D-glutamyl-L-lysine dipeptidyl-peptidase
MPTCPALAGDADSIKDQMKRFTCSATFFLALIAFSGCTDLSKEDRRFADIIADVESRYAPDLRTSVFGVTFTRTNKGIVLVGEVDNPEAKKAVIDALSPLVKKVSDNITILPEPKLGNQVWGIIRVSVANMRRDPDEASELVSQAIMGGPLKILRESGEWCYVQTPDKYLGWMRQDSFVLCDKNDFEAWGSSPRVIVLSTYGTVREAANNRSTPVCDIVAGSLLKIIAQGGAWTRVGLPDGRAGFVPTADVSDYEAWRKKTQPSPDGIERVARSLLGVPYMWGGTSTKAMDCSGFTKTVYMLNGILLSRDANQQAEQGTPVVPGEKFENLQKGDLLFFGRKANDQKPEHIIHVVLYLKDGNFIHASGMVRISSLDPSSPLFDPNKIRSFICARRLIPSTPSASEIPPRR